MEDINPFFTILGLKLGAKLQIFGLQTCPRPQADSCTFEPSFMQENNRRKKEEKKTYMLLEKSFLSTNKITSFAMQRNNHIAYIFNDSKPNHRIMKHVFSFKNYKAAKRKNMPQLHIFPCQLPNLGIFLTQTRFIRLLNDDYQSA